MNSPKADACIEMLGVYFRVDMRSGQIFRTLVDDWFAYSKGPPFLNKNGRPIWFNNPDPVKCRAALLGMHCVSVAAWNCIEVGRGVLVKDHAIPLGILEGLLRRAVDSDSNPAALSVLLGKYYHLGVITKEQDEHLNRCSLQSRMPDGWDEIDPLARYKAAGIKLWA